MGFWNEYADWADVSFETPEEKKARETREARLYGQSQSGTTTTPTAKPISGIPGDNGFNWTPGATGAPDGESTILPEKEDKDFSESSIYKQLEAGIIDDEQAAELFRKLGYDDDESKTMVALYYTDQANTNKPPSLSLANIFEAKEKGIIDSDEVYKRLSSAGYNDADIGIMMRLSQPEADKAKSVGEGSIWQAYDVDAVSSDEVRNRLTELGYSDDDANEMIQWRDKMKSLDAAKEARSEADRARAEQDRAESKARQAKNDKQNAMQLGLSRADNAPTARPAEEARFSGSQLNAKQIFSDFRSNFANTLKNQASGIGAPAQQWAMDNMDAFLPLYLQSGSENGAFTLGAQQINQAYESTRGAARASGRTGLGTSQVRSL